MRCKMRLWIIVVLSTFALSVAHAQEKHDEKKDETEESCDGSTAQMVECLARLTDKWDKRLNTAYQQALKDAVSKQQREQLRKAQRTWIAYRDANCVYYRLGEGSIAQLDAGTCMQSMTKDRALELEGEDHRN